MRRNRGSRASTMAVAGLLIVLGACSGGGDPKSLGPVPTAPSTTVEPTTTTTVPAATTTTARGATTTRPPVNSGPVSTVKPVVVDGVPQVTASPARAAVGARVRIDGTGFTDEMWQARGATLWLAEKAGCLYAEARHTVTVSAAGRLSGELTVPASGNCRMSDVGERPVTSGTYRIVFACTACAIGELVVTTTAGPCVNVEFAPNSDNLAVEIRATGVGCVEAEALVRKVGTQLRSVGGPSRVEADGWVCVRTSQSEQGLPSSEFECVNGSRKVTFRRF